MRTKEEILDEVIRRDIPKLLLPESIIYKKHNGIEYTMIRDDLAIEAMEEYANQDVRDKIYILNQLELIGDELFRKFGTESYELRCIIHDLKPKI